MADQIKPKALATQRDRQTNQNQPAETNPAAVATQAKPRLHRGGWGWCVQVLIKRTGLCMGPLGKIAGIVSVVGASVAEASRRRCPVEGNARMTKRLEG